MRLAALFLLSALAGCGAEPPEQSAKEIANTLSSVQIEPGLWERTTRIMQVRAPDLPVDFAQTMIGRTTVTRNCISIAQARQPQANFVAMQANSDCTYRDFSMREGRMEGTTTCTGGDLPGSQTIRTTGSYGPRSYDLQSEIVAEGLPGGNAMTIEARTLGRRVGDCPAADPATK